MPKRYWQPLYSPCLTPEHGLQPANLQNFGFQFFIYQQQLVQTNNSLQENKHQTNNRQPITGTYKNSLRKLLSFSVLTIRDQQRSVSHFIGIQWNNDPSFVETFGDSFFTPGFNGCSACIQRVIQFLGFCG